MKALIQILLFLLLFCCLIGISPANTDIYDTGGPLMPEQVSGRDLGWFFKVYARQPKLPLLIAKFEKSKLYISWKTPDNLEFPMPVDVRLGDKIKRVSIPAGCIKLDVPGGIIPEIDPKGWVLFNTESIADAKEQRESSDQPHRAARIE